MSARRRRWRSEPPADRSDVEVEFQGGMIAQAVLPQVMLRRNVATAQRRPKNRQHLSTTHNTPNIRPFCHHGRPRSPRRLPPRPPWRRSRSPENARRSAARRANRSDSLSIALDSVSDGGAELVVGHERLHQEGREPRGGHRAVFHVLQFQPYPPDAPGDACDGSGCRESRLEHRRNSGATRVIP